MENVRLSEEVDYASVYGLTREAREKLSKVRPVSLGQASRISGITPAALMAIQVHLKRNKLDKSAEKKDILPS
jgi:tRNA uridine 5-carboxymethylaminomethyl modification enzyme